MKAVLLGPCNTAPAVQVFSSMTEIVANPIRDLLSFYAEHHPEARFGELDISVLEEAVATLSEAETKIAAAEAALGQARDNYRQLETELLTKASRVMSFLKLHVQGNEEQSALLDSINLDGTTKKRARAGAEASSGSGEPRQRRSRKAKPSPELLSETSSADAIEPAQDEAESAPVSSVPEDGAKLKAAV